MFDPIDHLRRTLLYKEIGDQTWHGVIYEVSDQTIDGLFWQCQQGLDQRSIVNLCNRNEQSKGEKNVF